MVTLKRVAEEAGVSIKTVSRIVNGDAAVNAKTRAAVQMHLKQLNYVPNQAARQMRSGESSVIGLMTDVITTTPYSVDIVRGAQSALKDSHGTLLIASTEGDPEREKELWRMFRAHRVAGVAYAAMFHRQHKLDSGHAQSVVLANCFSAGNVHQSIVPDDEQGGYLQARYLLERGHRNISVITLLPDLVATKLREQGMRRAFAEAGVGFDASRVKRGIFGDISHEVSITHEVARDVLQQINRPTAIICGNDQIAMRVFAVAASLGLSIPQDLSVIGFDDLKLISETLHPTLTTVALPYFEIGRLAVEALNSAHTGSIIAPQIQRVPCPLVERQSCRPLA